MQRAADRAATEEIDVRDVLRTVPDRGLIGLAGKRASGLRVEQVIWRRESRPAGTSARHGVGKRAGWSQRSVERELVECRRVIVLIDHDEEFIGIFRPRWDVRNRDDIRDTTPCGVVKAGAVSCFWSVPSLFMSQTLPSRSKAMSGDAGCCARASGCGTPAGAASAVTADVMSG